MSDENDVVEREKELAARAAVEYVTSGMRVGLGSGTTSAYAVKALGERVKGGLDIVAVATSKDTQALAISVGIPMITTTVPLALDLTIDGADEFDPELRLIKGGGGDLLHEKIVASASRREIIIADHRKQVQVLGAFPLPVEVIPIAWTLVAKAIRGLGGNPVLRGAKGAAAGTPFITDEGNFILDCSFGPIREPEALARDLEPIPGIVEHGLFLGYASEVLLAVGDRVERILPPQKGGARG
ncbi:ribose-5-phosphate isomerase RpiA [Polyangium aurulentum]|uniref:ribose-5-phosphate isomerase RpiA n=1 Tax=Polyangium aurulentum TaxID=2567896 RepID=UPI0010ADEFA1|nr:ribose-5-phosphate isomerase RpiA [Polyangium aurulentum]UQA58370.1 ribose-5-phosphate isomerase RpiA [Polyangium aurulentum]